MFWAVLGFGSCRLPVCLAWPLGFWFKVLCLVVMWYYGLFVVWWFWFLAVVDCVRGAPSVLGLLCDVVAWIALGDRCVWRVPLLGGCVCGLLECCDCVLVWLLL